MLAYSAKIRTFFNKYLDSWYKILYICCTIKHHINVAKNQGLPKRSASKGAFAGKDQYFDSQTGEKVGEHLRFRKQAIHTIFVTMYLNDENLYKFLAGLGNQGVVIGYILKDYNDKTGMFYFSSTTKALMVAELKMSIGTIRKCVKDFANSRILAHVGGSEYMVNPHIFYKGQQIAYDKQVEAFDNLLSLVEFRVAEKRIDAKTVQP